MQIGLKRRLLVNGVVGLVVRISAFQADGPGSIPGQRILRGRVYIIVLGVQNLVFGKFFRVASVAFH